MTKDVRISHNEKINEIGENGIYNEQKMYLRRSKEFGFLYSDFKEGEIGPNLEA
jgi:hypothetical protein